jgi:hypothetical protein
MEGAVVVIGIAVVLIFLAVASLPETLGAFLLGALIVGGCLAALVAVLRFLGGGR